VEFSISISYISTNLSISKSVITSSPSPVSTGRLYAFYKPTLLIIFSTLNLILNYPSLELTMAVYRGLLTRWPLLYIPCVPYVPIWSSDVAWYRFWPVKAWDSLILKVGNVRKALVSP
jgi:hypothetical protein